MKAIIVEDEFPAREELKYFIKNFSSIEIISEFDNGIDVLKFIQENSLDVIFMDINIPYLDGILLAKTINKFKIKPKIVFISAYKEHAVEAFELEAFDYILKPYSKERIVSMLNKLEKSPNINNEVNHIDENQRTFDKISLWKNDKMIVIDIEDIYYCKAKERETLVYTKENEYSVNSSISEFEKSLPTDKFFKCHRSFIVNLSKIKEIIPWFNSTYNLKLENIDIDVPVSRSKIKEFKKLMNI
jgi:two-component system, LytTR family, response regulator